MNNNNSKFIGTKKAIIKWLDKYRVYNYTINDDLSVEVNGHVNISRKNLKVILVNFGKVTGHFWCNDNKLTSLIGSPETVGGHLNCSDNQLVTLAGSPKTVGGEFFCDDNKLTSLLEIINCNFKEKIYFNIDENNFQPKELIQILKKYYNSECERYELTNHQFHDIVKPQLEKEILQDKLVKSKIKNKTKSSFI